MLLFVSRSMLVRLPYTVAPVRDDDLATLPLGVCHVLLPRAIRDAIEWLIVRYAIEVPHENAGPNRPQ